MSRRPIHELGALPHDDIPSPEVTWAIRQDGYDPFQEHDMETLFTVGNGFLGIRGTSDEPSRHSRQGMFISGVYAPGPENGLPQIVVFPHPFTTELAIEGDQVSDDQADPQEHIRVLDLQHAVLLREWVIEDDDGRRTSLRTMRGASILERNLLFQYLEVRPLNYSGRITAGFRLPVKAQNMGGISYMETVESSALSSDGSDTEAKDGVMYVTTTTGGGNKVAVASRSRARFSDSSEMTKSVEVDDDNGPVERFEWNASMGISYTFQRLISVSASREGGDPVKRADVMSAAWADRPLEGLLSSHRVSWNSIWETSDVVLRGDNFIQQALRFYQYHLLISANPDDDKVSIGARTLSGEAYAGHVFWDTETFMLPFFVATQPEMARALMMYRYHTLDGARRKAKRHGYEGAFYAWESAETGDEATPEEVYLAEKDKHIPIHTGYLQVHISADVAHAVRRYFNATNDAEFMKSAGVEMLIETARFWKSRSVRGGDGLWHIEELQGPDEYHVYVSDNAYTNYMASWNVLRALESLDWMEQNHPEDATALKSRLGFTEEEVEGLREYVLHIYFPDQPTGPAIEQFRGYFDLDPRTVEEHGRRDGPLSTVLDGDLLQKTQVLKQPDTLLLFQLFPELACKIGFKKNFDYYEPRCDHGSSLAYPTHALLAARLGYMEKALDYLRSTAGLDLNDVMGNAPLGIHAATAGGLWQAVVFGFAGLSYTEEGIDIDPRMPDSWEYLEFSCFHHGALFRVKIDNHAHSWEIETVERL